MFLRLILNLQLILKHFETEDPELYITMETFRNSFVIVVLDDILSPVNNEIPVWQ